MLLRTRKFQPQIESANDSEKNLSKEYYLQQALENSQITSRTAKGVVDVSASKDKAREIQDITKKEAADRAMTNFKEVIEQLYEQRNRKFESPEELQAFVEDVARHINRGIISTCAHSYQRIKS